MKDVGRIKSWNDEFSTIIKGGTLLFQIFMNMNMITIIKRK